MGLSNKNYFIKDGVLKLSVLHHTIAKSSNIFDLQVNNRIIEQLKILDYLCKKIDYKTGAYLSDSNGSGDVIDNLSIPLIDSKPGMGKTEIYLAFIRLHQIYSKEKKKVIICCPHIALINEVSNRLDKLNVLNTPLHSGDHGWCFRDLIYPLKDVDNLTKNHVLITTREQLDNLISYETKRDNFKDYLVIVDESHLYRVGLPETVSSKNCNFILVSATPSSEMLMLKSEKDDHIESSFEDALISSQNNASRRGPHELNKYIDHSGCPKVSSASSFINQIVRPVKFIRSGGVVFEQDDISLKSEVISNLLSICEQNKKHKILIRCSILGAKRNIAIANRLKQQLQKHIFNTVSIKDCHDKIFVFHSENSNRYEDIGQFKSTNGQAILIIVDSGSTGVDFKIKDSIEGKVEVLIQLGDKYKDNKSDLSQTIGRVSRLRDEGERFGRYYYLNQETSVISNLVSETTPVNGVLSKNIYSNLYVALSKACVNPGRNMEFLDINKRLLDMLKDSDRSFESQDLKTKINLQKLLELEKFKDIQSLQKNVDFISFLENINNELIVLSESSVKEKQILDYSKSVILFLNSMKENKHVLYFYDNWLNQLKGVYLQTSVATDNIDDANKIIIKKMGPESNFYKTIKSISGKKTRPRADNKFVSNIHVVSGLEEYEKPSSYKRQKMYDIDDIISCD